MIGGRSSGSSRTQQASLVAAVALAVLAIAGLTFLHEPTAGFALGIGLLLGSLNGFMVSRTVAMGLPIAATSLARLMLLSAVGVAFGLLLGFGYVWLVVLGLGVSQLIWAGMNIVEALRR